jgi:hypothetical protein
MHVALGPETEAMLDAAELVLKRLPSSVATTELQLHGEVRGRVSWGQTQQRRWATSDPTLFVCRPAERRYDTPLGRLVLLAVRRCAELGGLAAVGDAGTAGEMVAEVVRRARRLLRNPKLMEVQAVGGLPERVLASLARERDAEPMIRFVRLVRDAVQELEPDHVEAAVAGRLLAPAQNEVLFELMVGFGLVDALKAVGYRDERLRLVGTAAVPFAQLVRHGDRLWLWWQRSLWQLPIGVGRTGRFHAVLDAAGMIRSSLRPDFLLVGEHPPRVLIVEVKHTEGADTTPERVGIREALAYIHDAASILQPLPEPHALVVAWDATGRPAAAPVVVSDQDRIREAIEVVLGQWNKWAIAATA